MTCITLLNPTGQAFYCNAQAAAGTSRSSPCLSLPAGGDYSTKWAPWLAHGCLSPRHCYHEIKRYERQTGTANKSTYWVQFELTWRDFYRWVGKRG